MNMMKYLAVAVFALASVSCCHHHHVAHHHAAYGYHSYNHAYYAPMHHRR